MILQNGSERAIQPHSFALLSQDDIEYLASIAPALFEGEKLLRLENRALSAQLGFIDSDDYISVNFFDYLLKIMTGNNCDIVECGVKKVYDKDDCDDILRKDAPDEGEEGFAWDCINHLEIVPEGNNNVLGKTVYIDNIVIKK